MAPNDKKSLPELAREKLANNPSALGDPVSLKAEKSGSEPTEQDRPNKNARGQEGKAGGNNNNNNNGGHKSLKDLAQDKLEKNPSQLGDPVSLKAETSDSHPTEQDRGAQPADPNKKSSKL